MRFGSVCRWNIARRICSGTSVQETKPLQLTIAVVKPHAVSHPVVVQEIEETILNEGFVVVCSKEMFLSRGEASQMYAEHSGKFFFQRAVELMSSGPLLIKLLARADAIQHWRTVMGPTKVFKTKLTHPDTLRGRFGLTDTRNAVHGSDSEASTSRECGFFFPEFDTSKWYEENEPLCRAGKVEFDSETRTHKTS